MQVGPQWINYSVKPNLYLLLNVRRQEGRHLRFHSMKRARSVITSKTEIHMQYTYFHMQNTCFSRFCHNFATQQYIADKKRKKQRFLKIMVSGGKATAAATALSP